MTGWRQAADQELLAALNEIQQQKNALEREMLELSQEVSARGLGGKHGFGTDIELLRCAQNITKVRARRRIDATQQVLPGRSVSGQPMPAALRETAAAVADSAISTDHVTAIRGVLASLPPHRELHREDLEAQLAGWARTFDPAAVTTLGRRRLAVLRPGRPRTARRRTGADPSLVLGARRRVCGQRLAGPRGPRGPPDRPRSPCRSPARGRLPDSRTPDPRSPAERQGDALVELARRMLDTGELPTEGGVRPHITLTVPLTVLEHRLGSGLLDFADGTLAGAANAEDARRLACDALVTCIVTGGRSEPLDIGCSSYTVPRAMRRVLSQRDSGCAFPGCAVPHQWTDAHHVRHWADGGATALHNLVLLCPRHHTVVHHSEWEVTITGGFPLFTRLLGYRAGRAENRSIART